MPDHAERGITASPFQSWTNWSVATIYVVFSVFSVISFAVLTNSIEEGTGLDNGVVSSIASVYFFMYAFFQLIAGMLIDRLGPKWLLGSTAIMATLGGFLFTASNTPAVLYLARGLMGTGLASSFVGALYLARIWFPHDRFAFMSGLTQMIPNLFGAIGSVLIAGQDYVQVVFVSSIANGVIAILIFMLVKNRTGTGNSDDHAQSSMSQVLRSMYEMGRCPQIWIASLYFAGTFGTFLAFADFWNIPFQEVQGHDAKGQALMNAALPIGTAFGSVFIGWVSDRLRKIAQPSQLLAILSAVIFAVLIFLPHLPTAVDIALLLLLGFTLGSAILAFPMASRHVETRAQGTVIGLVTTIGYLGAGLINVATNAIANAAPELGPFLSGEHSSESITPGIMQEFQVAFIPMLGLMLLAVAVSFLINDKK